jgi:hypothetical protein
MTLLARITMSHMRVDIQAQMPAGSIYSVSERDYILLVETERVKENGKVPLCGEAIYHPNSEETESPRPLEKTQQSQRDRNKEPSDRKVRRILLSIRRQSIEMAMSPGRASNPEPPRSPSQSTEIHADGAVRTIRQRPTKLCRTSAAGTPSIPKYKASKDWSKIKLY